MYPWSPRMFLKSVNKSKWGPWPYDVFFSWAWWGGGMVIARCVVVVDGPPRLPEAPRGCPETSKTMPLSSVFAVENSKTKPLSSKIDVPTGHFLEKQNTLKRNLIFPGHFPHGRFRAVDSPRFPRGSPQTVVNEAFSTKKQCFGSFFGALGEFPVLEPESYQTIWIFDEIWYMLVALRRFAFSHGPFSARSIHSLIHSFPYVKYQMPFNIDIECPLILNTL